LTWDTVCCIVLLMGQKVSKREMDAVEEMRLERSGLAGLVQCEGCPAGVLVVDSPETEGLCSSHRRQHPDAWMAYQPGPDEGYDVIGNL